MPRTTNNDRQNDMDDDWIASPGRASPERDDEGRFAGSGGSRRTRSRSDEDDINAGRGRGWFGDPEGHAQAGSHSHDYTRGSSRVGNNDQADDEADFGAWHAYGHNRGWHGYQRRGNQGTGAQGNTYRSRDDEGRFASSGGGRDYARDYEDDNRGSGAGGRNRQRDDEGRFASNNRH
jgi:hypothetical protein